jgi:lipoyl-dependent peroxiredoxin
MPRIERTATTTWEGNLARGSGSIDAASGAFAALGFSLATRVGSPEGKTSPEELLAAAHAGCYSTSLAGEIARAGGTVERLDVTCTVTLDEVEGKGHLIVSSELDVRAQAEGIDEAGLERVARKADEGCTLSALIRASASVSVRAELAS